MNKVAFSWYGGKTRHLKWLLPIIENISHNAYVESFGGSAAVLLNKTPSPVEVYNDINSEVVNFFKVLRTQSMELRTALELTPFSREEFTKACQNYSSDPLEAARQFFVKARQVRNGLATKATPGRWSYTKKDSRCGRALNVSHWIGAIEGLEEIVVRLKDVQIEQLDGLEIISRYDTENTLHYIDPPYLMSTRTGGINYANEFSEEQHKELISLVKILKGKVIISGYKSQLYSEMLPDWYTKSEIKLANSTLQDGEKSYREEVVWTNFQI